MDTQTLEIAQTNHEIEVRLVNLIFKNANSAVEAPIKYTGCMELDPQASLYHGERVKKLHPQFLEAWNVFMSEVSVKSNIDPTPDNIRQGDMGGVHLMGLIDLTLKLQDVSNKRIVWKYPESFLHPGWQVGLGDLIIWFAMRSGRKQEPNTPVTS
jgi:hypothetical protein